MVSYVHSVERVNLIARDWSLGPVGRPGSPWQRWRGLKARDAGSSLLIETKSVHSLGMASSFRAVALTADLEVISTRIMEPGQIARFPGCSYVLEMPVGYETPAVGTILELQDA